MFKPGLNSRISYILVICFLIFGSACDKNEFREYGFLEGTISIGPICPVEKIPPDPACLPTAETYKAYPVSIRTPDGGERIAQLNPALDGSYRIELESGVYLVVPDNSRNSITGNLPALITIIPATATTLNINIDTGIR